MKTSRIIATVSLMALFGQANAASVVYDLTATDVAGFFGPDPFGTVTLTENGANVDFVVQMNAAYDLVRTGNKTPFAFMATGVVKGDVKNIDANGNPPDASLVAIAPAPATPFGTLTIGITCPNGNTGCQNGSPGSIIDPLKFTVINASLSDFGSRNDKGAAFVVDAICVDETDQLCINGATGSIANVPLPGALGFMGMALAALGLVGRKRHN